MFKKIIAGFLAIGALIGVANGVLDWKRHENSQQFISQLAESLESQAGQETEDMIIESPTIKTNEVINNYILKHFGANEITKEQLREVMYPDIFKGVCESAIAPDFKKAFDSGITISYLYKDNQGNEVLYLPFTAESCKN